MSHTTLRSGYTELAERLNRFPQGAPPSDTLYKILKILFSEREAQLVALLPTNAEKASRVWKMDLIETRRVSDELSSRGILVDVEWKGKITYALLLMAGFFEFSMMHLRGDVDQKVLGKLLYQYLTSKRNSSVRYSSAARLSLGGSLCMSLRLYKRMPCMCWIMNAPAKSFTQPVTAESGSAIAATR